MKTLDKRVLGWAIVAVILFTIGSGTFIWHCDSCGKWFFGESYKAQDYKVDGIFSFTPSGELTLCENCKRTAQYLTSVWKQEFKFLSLLGTVSAVIAGYYLVKSFYDLRISSANGSAVSDEQLTSIPSKMNKRLLQPGDWVCSCGSVNQSYTSSCGCGKTKEDSLSQEELEKLNIPVELGNNMLICGVCHSAADKKCGSCPYCGTAFDLDNEPKVVFRYSKCPSCGAENGQSAAFCYRCGEKI